MECAQQAHLPDYLDSELPPAAERLFAAHVRRCRPCAEAMQVQQTVLELLDGLPREAAPSDFTARVLVRLPAPRRAAAPRRPAVVAAFVVAGLVGALGVWAWSLSAGFHLAALGRLATGWYAWCGDLGGTLARLQTLSAAEVQPVAAALWRAARAVGADLVAQLVTFWAVTFGLGQALHALGRPRRHSVLPS